jgi:hypothetical protein
MGISRKYRRINLYNQNPHCYWCNKKCTLIIGMHLPHPPKDLATTEHIWIGNTRITVLACYDCNTFRGKLEERRLIEIGVLPRFLSQRKALRRGYWE